MPGFVEDLASLFIKDIGLKGFFFFWFGIRLILDSQEMNWEILPPLLFFGRAWEESMLIFLYTFSRIH